MTDPIQGIGAIDKMKELDKASGVGGPQGASFDEVMGDQGAQGVEQAEGVEGVEGPQEVEAAEAPQEVEKSGAIDKMDQFLDGMSKDEAELNDLMERCMGGADLSQKELLRVQMLVYGYAQKVDLASKVVDKATGGIKQVMNTQV
jgi:hypothetical protein